ncbi:MAG: hypothetical protein AMJ93_09675 [Anaerolineae bacterium SM23_84]|nr:MAG: hypothetical protein AMJ93_09675 [Anaerolineae bacterium SM23_84]
MDDLAKTWVDLSLTQKDLLEQAQDCLRTVDREALRFKLQQHMRQQMRFPWLLAMPSYSSPALPTKGLSGSFPAPSLPSDFCVVGTDASCIAPDRHVSVRYYVLNVGYALLTYGSQPDAVLEASSHFCFRDEDLYVFPEELEVPIEGALLGARMEVESLRVLLEVVPDTSKPAVALRDGPLTLWTLQNESDEVQHAVLRDFLDAMAFLRQAGVPLAGYISYTGSRDVANSLRMWLCPGQPGECARCETDNHDLCLALAKIRDRDLFAFLPKGQRSELFGSSSQILERYAEHRVDFFYLNIGQEIVRVEVPRWVASNPDLLALVHAVLCDQCRRSPGFPPYPPALLEAHEQAVVTSSERRLVDEMVEQALGRHGQPIIRSGKDDSKRRRAL